MGERELERVREIALTMPEMNERLSHGTTCFYLRDKKPLCYFHDSDFHDEGSRVAVWCPTLPGAQEELVGREPGRYFRPQPSASGVFADWLGVYLDTSPDGSAVDWQDVTSVLQDAYRKIAPKKLSALLGPTS